MANIDDSESDSRGKSHSKDGSENGAVVEVTMTHPARPHSIVEEYERLFGVDEDAYEQPTTTRKELWSYYLYYNGESADTKETARRVRVIIGLVQGTTESAQVPIAKLCKSIS